MHCGREVSNEMSDMKEMYEKGYQAGHSDGFKRGRDEGYERCIQEKYDIDLPKMNYESGYHDGYREGQQDANDMVGPNNEEFKEGYEDGYKVGMLVVDRAYDGGISCGWRSGLAGLIIYIKHSIESDLVSMKALMAIIERYAQSQPHELDDIE